MKKALSYFVGEHDFKGFKSSSISISLLFFVPILFTINVLLLSFNIPINSLYSKIFTYFIFKLNKIFMNINYIFINFNIKFITK